METPTCFQKMLVVAQPKGEFVQAPLQVGNARNNILSNYTYRQIVQRQTTRIPTACAVCHQELNMKLSKQGDIKIIATIILALVVLGIAIYIIKGGLIAGKKSADGLGDCKSRGGAGCQKDQSGCGQGETAVYGYGGCKGDTSYCCISPSKP